MRWEAAPGPMEANEARARILEAFPPEAGLFKCSVFIQAGHFELAFHFPDVIRARYAKLIRTLETETMWKIRLRPTPHQGRLAEAAVSALPDGVTALKAPALRMDNREVAVELAEAEGTDVNWDALARASADRFLEETGYKLTIVRPKLDAAPLTGKTPDGAWEINRAYEEIRRGFRDREQGPFKVGLKSDASGSYIEAAFISPAVGERYLEELDGISKTIGWPIRIRESSNQEQITREAQLVTPESCGFRGTPRFFLADNRVVLPVAEAPAGEEREKLRLAFRKATGFEIAWEERANA